MTFVVFKNNGVMDERSIKTFGVSVKEGQERIGFFGTGLKYAISILLREGHEIVIQSGGTRYDFKLVEETIRGKSFQFIHMNGEQLGFTTEVGKTWELWQAFRELWCNTTDEDGEISISDEFPSCGDEETIVTVNSPEFLKLYHNHGDIILSSPPMIQAVDCNIHAGPSNYIYYKGIRVKDLPKPSLYTYNIMWNIDLTEDRTAKYDFEVQHSICGAIISCEDADVIEQTLITPDIYEQDLTYSSSVRQNKLFQQVVSKIALNPNFNRSALKPAGIDLLDILPKETVPLNNIQASQLRKAIDFCHLLDYPVDKYPIIVSHQLGDTILGRAHNETIYISPRAFKMGTKQVAATLLEEFVHLEHKLADCTRGLQDFLFESVLTLGEQMVGEPL